MCVCPLPQRGQAGDKGLDPAPHSISTLAARNQILPKGQAKREGWNPQAFSSQAHKTHFQPKTLNVNYVGQKKGSEMEIQQKQK